MNDSEKMSDIEKYVLEQAKTEVEQARSWPTKILAFYVAINAGLVTTLFALANRSLNPYTAPCYSKTIIAVAMFVLAVWALYLLKKSHITYLKHRQLQVQFQKANKAEIEKQFTPPPEWFVDIDIRLGTRWQGWGFYACLVVLVLMFSIFGVYLS